MVGRRHAVRARCEQGYSKLKVVYEAQKHVFEDNEIEILHDCVIINLDKNNQMADRILWLL